MLQDYTDSVTKTYGIRSGEPKRPESLIEMPGMIPEVPEVSLCFNQDKYVRPQTNKTSSLELDGNDLDYRNQRHQQIDPLHRNNYESYNTWKAKNAQALHNITGGKERTDPGSKHSSNTKRSAGLVRKQSSGKEIYSPPMVSANYSIKGTPEHVSVSQQKESGVDYSPHINENCAPTQMSTSTQPDNSHIVKHDQAGFIVYKQPFLHQVSEKSDHNGIPVYCAPNYCNKLQCSCEKQKALVNPINGNQFSNEKPPLTKESGAHDMRFIDTTKFYSPLDTGLINNTLSNLTHIVSIQKEQISVLCQEVNNQKLLMSALLEEVKKIHVAVSPSMPIQVNCDIPPTNKKSCQSCSCEHKDNEVKNDSSEDPKKSQTKHNGSSASKHPPDNIEKKSVGVMTSDLENTTSTPMPSNKSTKTHTVNDSPPKAKKQNQKQKVVNSPSNKNKQTHKKELTHREENRKSHSNQNRRRKNKNEKLNESSQSGDSLSLDEAAVLTRTEPEQGFFSPDVSIHVNMPDYSASSAESDTSDSSDSADEGQESGTEGESSDPQIGWTFYNRVVGQVNNMLKKSTNDPRQEYGHTQRNNPGNLFYHCNGDYETENNWSKRVTFDGPPLEDSDNNGMHMPRYNHYRTNQDYRMPGGPERMQDFLMCDYANGGNNLSLVNGSTNVSFATYRYYQRHQLLPPPPPGMRVPDQVFLDTHQMKNKSKTRKNEKTPPMTQKSHNRRSGRPSSKILDMSALKRQPKLF